MSKQSTIKMDQVRVFVANSCDTNIDINDAAVQSILRTGNRVAFIYNDEIHYAIRPDQTKWYTFIPESGASPAIPIEQNVHNAHTIISNKGTEVEPFAITKDPRSNSNGDQWFEFTIADNAFKHERLLSSSHLGINLAYSYIANTDEGETTSDLYSDENKYKTDFQNVLAMIFRQTMKSVNHNIEGLGKVLTNNDLVRKYTDNNLVSYAIHTDKMVLDDDGTQIQFSNIPAGQYKFPVAKIVHANPLNIAAVQQIVVSAYKDGSTYYVAKAFVTPAGMNISSEVRSGCEDRDINISSVTNGGISTIFMNITFDSVPSHNIWTCNANITGLDHTRFPKLLSSRFHSVVGTSYDCFLNNVTIDSYTPSDAGEHQERYISNIMHSKGLPYAIRVNIKANSKYTSYVPNFIPSEEKSYSMSIDGVEYYKYTTVSADNKSLIYDAAYEKPSGLLMFIYKDIDNGREYTASYKIEELSNSSYNVESIGGQDYNVLDIDVMVTRGRANLNSVDGISFVAYAVLPSKSSNTFPDYNAAGFDLDSYLTSPNNAEGITQKTFSYNDNASSMLGLSLNGSCTAYSPFVENAINTYCSGDNRVSGQYAIGSFPYIRIPAEYKQQSDGIEDNIANSLVISDSTYAAINTEVARVTEGRVSITNAEYNSIDKTSESTIKADLSRIVAKKLLDNWTGEIVSSELYYFNMGHPYFEGAARDRVDKWTFTAGYNDIPSYVINYNREIYNVIFTIHRNAKRDDSMDISIDDIETDTITFGTASASNPQISVKCPVYLNRRFNGQTYRYKLSHQQEVSTRVLKEHAYAFCGSDNDTLANTTQGIFSFLYKIEPEEGKTAANYPADDYLLGTDDYPVSQYDPKYQSKGCWLMCNPLLHTASRTGVTPLDFASTDIQEYHPDTHIFKISGTFYYANAYNIYDESATSYNKLSEQFVKGATETGLPMFSIVFFDVKAINPLSMNLKLFVQSVIKKYVEEHIADNPGATIDDVPSVTYETATTRSIACDNSNINTKGIMETLHKLMSDSTSANITFSYGDAEIPDFWPVAIWGNNSNVLYGVYNYNTDPSVDDWEFKFVTE